MEKIRTQLAATVAFMLGNQYEVSILTQSDHVDESLKKYNSTYFIQVERKAKDSRAVIPLDPVVKSISQNEISTDIAAALIIFIAF